MIAIAFICVSVAGYSTVSFDVAVAGSSVVYYNGDLSTSGYTDGEWRDFITLPITTSIIQATSYNINSFTGGTTGTGCFCTYNAAASTTQFIFGCITASSSSDYVQRRNIGISVTRNYYRSRIGFYFMIDQTSDSLIVKIAGDSSVGTCRVTVLATDQSSPTT